MREKKQELSCTLQSAEQRVDATFSRIIVDSNRVEARFSASGAGDQRPA
jgi:hypothetical protein